MILLRFIFCLLASLCLVTNALALNFSKLHEVQLPVPATLADRTLGTALAISGSTAAVAAHSSDNAITGSVYLYDAQENWRLTTELTSGLPADNFARRLILADDLLIVSADRDDELGVDSGAVYFFERISADQPHHWQQTAKLTAPDTQAGDQFGGGIAWVNGTLYIGAPTRGQGKVYIFSRDNESREWRAKASIEPEDPQALRFGAAIAQDGQTLIIGAPFTDADNSEEPEAKGREARFAISKGDTFDPGIESGAIFVYQNNEGKWQVTERIGASNRETGDHLGEQIAIEGDIIAASLKQKDIFDDLRAGTIYVYKYNVNTWQEDSALVAERRNLGANFGNSFALLDKQVLVGANKVHSNGFNSGQAYLFSQNADNAAWELKHLQANAGLTAHDQFGLSVALDSEHMLIASRHAVYAFQNTPIDYYAAIFYPDTNTLQLNEIELGRGGVLKASLHFSQAAGALLTLTDFKARTDIEQSDIKFFSGTAQLTIPKLAVWQSATELTYYTVVLQQISNLAELQFRIVSIKPVEL